MTAEQRYEILNAKIEQMFGDLHPDHVQALGERYDACVTEMIEVEEVVFTSASVVDYGLTKRFSPVALPMQLAPYVKPRDVFLVTMGLSKGVWYPLYMSPAHELEEVDWDDEDL